LKPAKALMPRAAALGHEACRARPVMEQQVTYKVSKLMQNKAVTNIHVWLVQTAIKKV